MLKNIQSKIILVVLLLGLIIIGIIGIRDIIELNSLAEQIQTSTNAELVRSVEQAQVNAKIFLAVGSVLYITFILMIKKKLSKYVVYPINRLIKSSDNTSAKEETKKQLKKENLEKVDDIFGLMTTELKDQLNEVSTKKNQIETILRHMTDGIIAFNMNKEIILINPVAKKLLGIRPEDNTFEDIFNKFKLDINMEKIIYLENWASSEQRVEADDKYINIFFAPFKNQDDRPDGVIAVVQDITEHVKLDNMRKEFVADVSHELKTPITSIMGYADTLLEGDYDKETQDKFLNVIASEARRMAKLVTDLLTLSRYDSKKQKTQKEEFDLGDLVKKCQDKLAIEIKKKNHVVNCFVTADVPPVYADKYDIERVILNILTNSIKYTKDGGEIKIYVGFVYNDAYIKVFDNGIGIPEEDLSRIFERFYRVDKARTREMGGTGLGLSIAKEILDKNGGSIDIKSVVGQGTEVVIKIPTKS